MKKVGTSLYTYYLSVGPIKDHYSNWYIYNRRDKMCIPKILDPYTIRSVINATKEGEMVMLENVEELSLY